MALVSTVDTGVNGIQLKGTGVRGKRFTLGGGEFLTKRTCLSIPDGVPMEAWKRLGRNIFVISEASAWWLGDWLVYGQRNYPDRYKRAIEETGLDYQTLRNYAWVARKFTAARRREGLSFQHHAEVAGLPQEQQERWLAQADAGGWSRNELRARIRGAVAGEGGRALDAVVYVRLKALSGRKEQWQQAADSSGMPLLDWIASILDDAAQNAKPIEQTAATPRG